MSGIAALNAFLEEVSAPPQRGGDFPGDDTAKNHQYQYWRKADGWIVVGPAWASEYRRQRRKGMEPLDQFGEFARRQGTWDSTHEPFKMILARGGAGLFCREQVLELGWHRKPPYGMTITFPALAGEEVLEIECPACSKKFVEIAPGLAQQNLRRHEMSAHKETSTNNALARAITDAQQHGLTGPMAEVLSMLATGQQQLAQAMSAITQRLERLDAPAPEPKSAKPAKPAPAPATSEATAPA